MEDGLAGSEGTADVGAAEPAILADLGLAPDRVEVPPTDRGALEHLGEGETGADAAVDVHGRWGAWALGR